MTTYIKNEGNHKIWTQVVNGTQVKFFINGNKFGFKIDGQEGVKQVAAKQMTEQEVVNFLLEVSNI